MHKIKTLTKPKHPTLLGLDLSLILGLFALLSYSSIILYSASNMDNQVILKQSLRILAGFLLLILAANIPLRLYYVMAPYAYCFGILLLLAVLIFGHSSHGAKRWLNLILFKFQAAELMKIFTPLMVAFFLSNKAYPLPIKDVFIALGLSALPSYLIFKQPDLGTSILIFTSGLLVIFFAGVSIRFILNSIAALILSLPLLWYNLHNYQQQRILTLLQADDPLGKGYHIIQSKIAIGSGGLLGKGLGAGTQANLEFLPEKTTDFIFAVIGEEFGFIGFVLLLILYLFITLRCFYISYCSNSNFSKLLGIALTTTFFLYMFINIAMVSGILPVVGIPLPLFSYGGTAMLSLMLSFGIIMAIRKNQQILYT